MARKLGAIKKEKDRQHLQQVFTRSVKEEKPMPYLGAKLQKRMLFDDDVSGGDKVLISAQEGLTNCLQDLKFPVHVWHADMAYSISGAAKGWVHGVWHAQAGCMMICTRICKRVPAI